MWNGAFALLERSLRVDARARSTHLTRFLLMAAIYVALCYAAATSIMIGAPGMRFFRGIAYLDATFLTLMGISYFSNSITEEKEEDTLGLILMAGISPLGILIGKSGGRLFQALLLVAVQYPLILLAVTLGGIMGSQVWAATIALLAYLVFLAGAGLLCSTLVRRSQTAAAWMFFILLIYMVIPSFAKAWTLTHLTSLINHEGSIEAPSIWWTLVGLIGEFDVFSALGKILSTGNSETVWSVQVISNVLAGVACASLAWLLFGVATRNPSTEAISRGLVARQRALSPFTAGRVWDNPFLWKDFHFISGGVGMLLMRVTYYGGLGATALVLEYADPQNGAWVGICIFLICVSIPIDAAKVLSRSLQEEVRGQTLQPLLMLPRSTYGIIYSKFAGALIGWLPGPIIGLMVTILSPNLRTALFYMASNPTFSTFGVLIAILYFSLLPHYAALTSLYVRWGAVALAIGMTIVTYFALMMGIGILFFFFNAFLGGGGGGNSIMLLFFSGISVALAGLCAACHVGIFLRIQALGSK